MAKSNIRYKCSRCGKIKPISEFRKNPTQSRGYSYYCKECENNYAKEWRRKHPERIKAIRRKHYQKHREEIRQTQKEYHKIHKKEIEERKKKYYRKNKKYFKKYMKEYYQKKKIKIIKLLGDKCILCGRKNGINYHEIHGKQHTRGGKEGLNYILKHPEDFIPLCGWCHKTVHQVAKEKLLKNEKFLEFIKFLSGY